MTDEGVLALIGELQGQGFSLPALLSAFEVLETTGNERAAMDEFERVQALAEPAMFEALLLASQAARRPITMGTSVPDADRKDER